MIFWVIDFFGDSFKTGNFLCACVIKVGRLLP